MSNSMHHADAQRLLDLLADRATGMLAATEEAELQTLLSRSPAVVDDRGVAITAESMDVAVGEILGSWMTKEKEVLPASLRNRLVASARESGGSPEVAGRIDSKNASSGGSSKPLVGPLGWLGWVAAAAAIIFAVVLSSKPSGSGPGTGPAAVSLGTQLAQLRADTTGTVEIEWVTLSDPTAQGVTGHVFWNQKLQKGFLVFKGLPQNDPSKEQYQAWIVDGGRTNVTQPLNGGVFDIAATTADPATGLLIVPIKNELAVRAPSVFMVTVEAPGGVVVTDAKRPVVMAKMN